MPELALNSSPLNKLAKKALGQLKVDARPDHLYLLQLAEHVVLNHPELPSQMESVRPQLEDSVLQMYGWKDQKNSLKALMNADDSLPEIDRKLAKEWADQPPMSLGQLLLDNLMSKILENSPERLLM